MHSYCRREGSKFRKPSPIPNTVYLLQTYGVMSFAPWFLPLEIQDADTVQWSVEKSPTAVGDISINRWRYFQRPLNHFFFPKHQAQECNANIRLSLGKCKFADKQKNAYLCSIYYLME